MAHLYPDESCWPQKLEDLSATNQEVTWTRMLVAALFLSIAHSFNRVSEPHNTVGWISVVFQSLSIVREL
ncbi:hypothetical protein PISMIDRAFT_14069 [Pisolithus microcarpus 441]|uniref:Uncharacterized protein n=1 Tax=Pisolithus microcarpus 441 TaxID=765257 RepID=A0A0C9YQN4_9AGAM|nr:hypothetical protein PISMIDRAFT_14069 [Pisolithus microcarpus 441]